MIINYYKKNVYGVEKMYMIGNKEAANAVRVLTGRVTLLDSDIRALQDLGHEVNHTPIN